LPIDIFLAQEMVFSEGLSLSAAKSDISEGGVLIAPRSCCSLDHLWTAVEAKELNAATVPHNDHDYDLRKKCSNDAVLQVARYATPPVLLPIRQTIQ